MQPVRLQSKAVCIFAVKINYLSGKIKVGGISYLNTRPLMYGIERSPELLQQIALSFGYPAMMAQSLQDGAIDLALLPVAAIPGIEGARIVGDYGIAADGEVASVCIYSHVPMEQIETVYLDYQSRTSVRLARLLLEQHWQQKVEYRAASEHYIEYINGPNAGVIIGDRALQQRSNFEYIYDLSAAWKDFTGLPFVFAAWVANKELPEGFIRQFNEANALGLQHIDEIVAATPFPYYDLKAYYTENIHYRLDAQKLQGLERFLQLIGS